MESSGPPREIHYHLELTPAQLKIAYTALRSLLDDFGHDEAEVIRLIHEVLAKLPDEHAIRAIDLNRELGHGAQAAVEGALGPEPPEPPPAPPPAA